MLDKDVYDSWKSRMELYMQNREHRRMILESVENGSLIWPTVEENRVIRTKKYAKLSAAEKIQADCDMKATNIILQDSGFAVPVFYLGDDQLHVSTRQFFSNSYSFLKATIQDGRVTVQQVQGRQGQSYFGTSYKSNATSSRRTIQARVVKCYNCQGEGHMARQCTEPKRRRSTTWYKDKAMLAEAQEAGQTEDLKTYDSNCDDASNAKVVLMANISYYGPDVISETPHSKTYLNDMKNQSQFAHTVHMLTKPQGFYDDIHKKALGYQNLFYLKEAQQIKPTLYDGIVISNKHVAMPVIDNEETLILEDASRSLKTYDSNCDDASNAKVVLMANISNYGPDVISETPHSKTYLNDMENQ
nr:hypothetical protein [Tanacetum cinerariifolium]